MNLAAERIVSIPIQTLLYFPILTLQRSWIKAKNLHCDLVGNVHFNLIGEERIGGRSAGWPMLRESEKTK
jgi:hypothetical protein